MKLFEKPKWLKPEINEMKYYVHILIVVGVALITLKYFFGHDMLTIAWTLKVSFGVILGDITAHTLLKLD